MRCSQERAGPEVLQPAQGHENSKEGQTKTSVGGRREGVELDGWGYTQMRAHSIQNQTLAKTRGGKSGFNRPLLCIPTSKARLFSIPMSKDFDVGRGNSRNGIYAPM
jgi:hypothetical protein